MKRNRINFTVTGILFVLFIVFTAALQSVDVKPIGPNGSSVGFASINKWIAERIGSNMFFYNLTDWFGVVAILVAFGFAVLGLVQLIKRKSLKRVDRSILVLGGFYLITIFAYLFFEYKVINYRPVLIANALEASYPSSTTMLVLCVMPTAMMQFHRLIKNTTVRMAINVIFAVFTTVTLIGRVLSGVHWLTDILGGAMLSAALIMLFYSVDKCIESKQQS